MKHVMALALAFALVVGALAAPAPQGTTAGSSTATKKKAAAKTSAPSVSSQLSEMKQAIDAQQQQIQQLMQQVQSRDAAIQQLQQQVGQAQSAAGQAAQKADAAASEAAAGGATQQQDFAAMKTDVADLKQNATNAALSLQETQKNIKDQLESPLAIHYKGVTITPGGFIAAETVWRSHGLGADINTPFNSITFDGAGQSHLAEFFGSGRQSRLSTLIEGKLNTAKLTGYYESDFLSAAVTSNNNQSNSYSLRVRQAWAQAALNSGWSFTGGQMWSLVTETKKGVDNRSEALPMTIDPQYTVGFSWARQYGFRISKNIGNKAWMAFSVEDSQETIGGHGSTTNFLLGQQGASGGSLQPDRKLLLQSFA